MWSQFQELKDPISSYTNSNAFYILMIIMSVIYILWLFYLMIRTSTDSNIPLLGIKIKFFGVFTSIIILVTFVGILFQYIGPLINSSSQYLAFLSIFNLYVYTLAYVYLPSASFFGTLDSDSMKMVLLDKDDNDYFKLNVENFDEEDDDYDTSFDISDNNIKTKEIK